MASVRKWRALNKTIAIKLDEGEAAWEQANEELVALQSSILRPDQLIGIESRYAHLAASFKALEDRNASLARFGKPAVMQTIALENLLVGSRVEPRSVETRTGQLFRIFAAAQEWVDDMNVQHDIFEGQVQQAFTRLQEEQEALVKAVGDQGFGKAVAQFEALERLVKAIDGQD